MKRKILITIFTILDIIIIYNLFFYKPASFNVNTSEANLSDYRFISEEKTSFKEIKMEDVYDIVTNKQGSGIVFMGANWCEFCQRAIKVLNDISLKTQTTIYYVDSSDLSDEEIDLYYKLTEMFSDIFPANDSGEHEFNIPTVISIFKGNIKSVHSGLIGDVKLYSDKLDEFSLSSEQEQQLSDLYLKMIKLSKKGFYFSYE